MIELTSQLIKYFVSHITGLKTCNLSLIFWLSILYLIFIKIESWILQSKSYGFDRVNVSNEYRSVIEYYLNLVSSFTKKKSRSVNECYWSKVCLISNFYFIKLVSFK